MTSTKFFCDRCGVEVKSESDLGKLSIPNFNLVYRYYTRNVCRRCAKQVENFAYKKPPLGLVPRYVRDEQRAREIIDAVLRYIDNGKPVPHEWIAELAERTTAKESEAK